MAMESLVIKKEKQLHGGAQAEVFKCRIGGFKGRFVDKTRRVFNNDDLAAKTMKEMFSEFMIAKDLIHPNIIEYQYFMRTYDKQTKYHDFHMLTEYQEGEDMSDYLKD